MATTELSLDLNKTEFDKELDGLEGNFTMAPTIQGFFNGDLLLHPFWYPYREMIEAIPHSVHYLLGIFIAIAGIFGITGNILIIYMFLKIKSLRTPSNLFIINMAISDLGFSAIIGFPLMTISCFMKKWYFGKIACEIYAFLGGLFGFNSINSLAWISYDRMFVITNPFEAMRKSTMKRSSMQLIFVWSWALLWSVPPLFGWGAYIPEGFMTSCSFDYLTQTTMNITYVWSMFAFAFLAPIAMIVYCYMRIIHAVTSQNKEMEKRVEKMGANKEKDKKGTSKAKRQEIALAKVAAVTITFFLLSWLPYAIVSMGGISGYTWLINPYTCVIPVMFAKCSAIWNPVLYSLSHPRFRAALDEMFPALVLFRGLCMDKGGNDDAETSDGGAIDGKKKRNLGRSESSFSETVEITEIENTSGIEKQPNVQMSPDPGLKVGREGGNASARKQPPQQVQQQHQPQEAQVPPGGDSQYQPSPHTTPCSHRRSFKESIGKAAGKAYRNLIDAYIGLKNISDKLDNRPSAMVLLENHPANRCGSSVSIDNSAINSQLPSGSQNVSCSPFPVGVYSVPVADQQRGMSVMQHKGYEDPPPPEYTEAQMMPSVAGQVKLLEMVQQQQLVAGPVEPAKADAAPHTPPLSTSTAATTAAATSPASTVPDVLAPASAVPAATSPAATSPAATTAAAQFPASTSPAVTSSAASSPAAQVPALTSPPAAAPAATVPVATVPAATTPAATAPAATVPAATTPAATVPAATVPAATVTAATIPAATVPAASTPAASSPAAQVPASTSPAAASPAASSPAAAFPAATSPAAAALSPNISITLATPPPTPTTSVKSATKPSPDSAPKLSPIPTAIAQWVATSTPTVEVKPAAKAPVSSVTLPPSPPPPEDTGMC